MPGIIEEAARALGGKKIEILVNAAGVLNSKDFMDIDIEEYDRVMDINLKGTFFMCQAMSKYMIDNKIKGHILNITSSSALRPAWTPYQISKWALRGFTLGLADMLLPHGIIVNAIAPGPTATPMLGHSDSANIYSNSCPAGRLCMPDEVAALAAFMVSDYGNMIVGDTYYISGGSGITSLHR